MHISCVFVDNKLYLTSNTSEVKIIFSRYTHECRVSCFFLEFHNLFIYHFCKWRQKMASSERVWMFATREERVCRPPPMEDVLVWRGSTRGWWKVRWNWKALILRFIQRASLAISCVSSSTSANSLLARVALLFPSHPSRRRTVKTQFLRTFELALVNTFLRADGRRRRVRRRSQRGADEVSPGENALRCRGKPRFEYPLRSLFQILKPV